MVLILVPVYRWNLSRWRAAVRGELRTSVRCLAFHSELRDGVTDSKTWPKTNSTKIREQILA